MATNDLAATTRGIRYPTNPTKFASADWWKALAESVDAAITTALGNSGWQKPLLDASTDLDGLRAPGAYRGSKLAPVKISPFPDESFSLEIVQVGDTWTLQRATSGGGLVKHRVRAGGAWSPWTQPSMRGEPLKNGEDLNTISAPGIYTSARHWPLNPNGAFASTESFTLEVMPLGETWILQRATSETGDTKTRIYGGGVWRTQWKSLGAGAAGGGMGLQARMPVESTGEWSSLTQVQDYLKALSAHREVELLTIGKSVNGVDIQAIRIGDKTKDAFLAIGGQHSDEPGNTHGLSLWARQLVEARSTLLMDMCVLIVPLVNPDSWLVRRQNVNGIDLNRDWLDFSQPEVKAVKSLIDQHKVVASVDGHSYGYPRQVSMRIPTFGTESVKKLSQELYDAVAKAITDDGQFTRQYAPENHDGMHHQGMAKLGVPSIILEVPSGFNSGDTPKNPNRYWQARMSALSMNAAAHKAWTWTQSYKDAMAAL